MNEEIKRRFFPPQWMETSKFTFGFRRKSIVAYVTIRKPTWISIVSPERNLCRVILLLDSNNGVITTATICQGNRRPAPSILANNLLSCNGLRCPFLLYKKKKTTDLPLRPVVIDLFFVIFHFPIHPFAFPRFLSIVSRIKLDSCFLFLFHLSSFFS